METVHSVAKYIFILFILGILSCSGSDERSRNLPDSRATETETVQEEAEEEAEAEVEQGEEAGPVLFPGRDPFSTQPLDRNRMRSGPVERTSLDMDCESTVRTCYKTCLGLSFTARPLNTTINYEWTKDRCEARCRYTHGCGSPETGENIPGTGPLSPKNPES